MANLQFPQPKLVEKSGGGVWRLTGRVVLPECQCLDRAVELLGEDYPALAAAEKVHGGEARDGDLVVCVGRAETLEGKNTFGEGFVVEAGPAAVLTAQSERAAVYGLRTVFESGELAYGVTADWPSTNERGLHLDAGRKYYTKQWIMEQVKDLSRNRMNVLWLHFSENEGFRIDSERHPEVPSRFFLTKDEVREIIALCNSLFVDINPALDCPGHLGTALLEHPRWRLNREMAEPLYSAQDITNPDARAFLLELVDEYAELFAGSKVFHIGGDEFIDFNHFERFPEMEAYAKEHLGPDCGGVDLYVEFLNQVIAHVRAKGFQVRVWNDGLFRPDQAEHVKLDKDVQIAFWSNWDKNMAPLQAFLDRGYQVVNYHADYLYYILLVRKNYADPDPDKLLNEWHPGMFPTHPTCGEQVLDTGSEHMLGCCYSIWSDWPDEQSEEEVHQRSVDSIRAFGIRCWQ